MKPAVSLDPSIIRPTGPWQHRDVSAGGMRFHVVETGVQPVAAEPNSVSESDLTLPEGLPPTTFAEAIAPMQLSAEPLSIILLHGFPEFWRAWIPVIKQLQQRLGNPHILIPDLRGCGGSDKQPHGYELANLATDIAALAASCGIERALVVGHGTGGQVGWMLAHSHPELVERLVVVASPHPLEVARRWGLISPKVIGGHVMADMPWVSERLMKNGTIVRKALANWSDPANAPRLIAESSPYCEVLKMPQAAYAMLQHARRCYRFPRATKRALKEPLQVPVLSVQAASDPVFGARAFTNDPEHVDDAVAYRSVRLPNSGHFVPEEQPEALAELIAREFRAIQENEAE